MTQITLPQIKLLVEQLSFDEQLVLLEHLAQRVRSAGAPGKAPRDVYGIWKGRFPENVDIDQVLHEIRSEWEQEWTDQGEFRG